MDPNDISQETIKKLFEQQMRKVTARSCNLDTFDYQFSDGWM